MIAPRFTWPEYCRPEREPGWDGGIRVVWLSKLNRFIYCPTTVPDIRVLANASSSLSLRSGLPSRLNAPLPILQSNGEPLAVLQPHQVSHIESALECPMNRLTLQATEIAGSRLLLVKKKQKLRAAANLIADDASTS